MQSEGMVHALEEIHSLLKPNGCLIDIHPVLEPPQAEVYQAGKLLYSEISPENFEEDYRQAENELHQVVQRRLYDIDGSGEFDFLTYASSVIELYNFFEEISAYSDRTKDEELAAQLAELAARVENKMQAAGEGAEVGYHERARITRLRPIRG
jgi:hypothetical protein